MTASIFAQLQLLLTFEISRFEGKLRSLAAGEYPTEVGPSLITQLLGDLAAQRADVEKIALQYATQPQLSFARLQTEHIKLVFRLSYVTALENAQTEQVPWSLVPSIERLATLLLPDRELLTTCIPVFNYQIRWSTSGEGINRYHLLSMPAVHRINVFLHVLIGHELFHPVVHDFLVAERPRVYASIKAKLNSLQIPGPRRVDEVVELIADIWRDGLKELMCDMGCVALFGPAALLAMLAFSTTTELDAVNAQAPFYPPQRYRLRNIARFSKEAPSQGNALQALFSNLNPDSSQPNDIASIQLEKQLKELEDLASIQTDLKAIQGYPPATLAYQEIEATLGRAWSFVETKVMSSSDLSPWTSCTDEVPHLLRCFRQWVPAGEVRKSGEVHGPPSSFTAVMLAAWMYELESSTLRDGKSPVDILREYGRTCGLVLKSVEDAELKRIYLERLASL